MKVTSIQMIAVDPICKDDRKGSTVTLSRLEAVKLRRWGRDEDVEVLFRIRRMERVKNENMRGTAHDRWRHLIHCGWNLSPSTLDKSPAHHRAHRETHRLIKPQP